MGCSARDPTDNFLVGRCCLDSYVGVLRNIDAVGAVNAIDVNIKLFLCTVWGIGFGRTGLENSRQSYRRNFRAMSEL